MKDNEIYVYRIKHIPTGLYFQTVTGHYTGKKSNLGERGKCYFNRKPPIPEGSPYISNALIKKFSIPEDMLISHSSYRENQKMVKASAEDWKIIKYTIQEIEG